MDTLLFWLGLLAKILIGLLLIRVVVWCVFSLVKHFLGVNVIISGWRLLGFDHLTIKSHNLDLQINNLFVSLRWFDPTCRHFFKFNIAGVHVEYYSIPGEEKKQKRITVKIKKGHSRKRRFLYWGLRKILKLTELSVKCLEVWAQDNSKSDISLVTVCQVLRRFTVIAQPLPDGELGLSLEVDKLAAQFLLQTDRPCTSTDDGLYPLADLKLSTKAVLFLRPLAVEGGLVKSVQLNVVPVSLSLIQQDLVSKALIDYGIVTPEPIPDIKDKSRDNSRNTLQQRLSQFPEKMEVVLEDVNLLFHATNTNRVMSSKLTRVSVAANLPRKDNVVKMNVNGLPLFDVTIGVQELSLVDSHSRKALRLQQLRLLSELSSKALTNEAHIHSLHVCLWEQETMFWSKFTQENFNNIRAKLKAARSAKRADKSKVATIDQERTKSSTLSQLLSRIFNLPLSVVTTVEASDWSVQLHMDSLGLQSKEPFCRVVMAACAGNVQWNDPKEDEAAITIRSSLRLADTYLHIPGYHPTVDNPTFYRQRIDNPQVLPSLHNHLWGRVASIGSLTLKGEKEIKLSQRTDPDTPLGPGGVELTDDPFRLSGEGSCLMMEWSQPTVVAAARFLDHVKNQYGAFVKEDNDDGSLSSDQENKDENKPSEDSGRGWFGGLPQLDFGFQLTDVNLFLCALTPEPPSMMVRLDAGSVSSSSLPSFSLSLHNLLVDDMHLQSFEQVFVCSNVANLPYGAGVVSVTTAGADYDHQIKDVSLKLAKLSSNWTTTAHRCLFRVGTYFLEDIKLLAGVLKGQIDSKPPSSQSSGPTPSSVEIIAIGEMVEGYLERVPVSVSVHVESTACVAQIDRKTKVSLDLTNIQSTITGGVAVCSSQEVGVAFDKRRIISLYEVIVRFPQEDNKLEEGRKKLKFKLERERNPVLWLQASRVDLIFPSDYNFSLAYDKMMNIKKFLQKMHVRLDRGKGTNWLYLPPDVLAECEDILLQVNDDPFEIKLRSNYELLCDEFEQKTQRLAALNQKLNQIRQQEGVTAVSGEKVQSLYSSLEVKDSEIYCQRAKKLYSSPEATKTGLFMFTMEHTKLLAMFDTSMLGEEKLVRNLKEIDSISPFPQNYSFSTLWGCYVSGSTDKLQMQVRDYPIPLIAITEVTATGRMVFAEQEAQDREQRSAVVEVGHPWSNVTIKRKLPPLKYYYDLEMTSETWDMAYGPCLEPGIAQTNIGFGRLTSPTIDQSRTLPYWDKLRLLFHGPIHLTTNEMRVLLPATFNPYNSVECLEIRMCQLDVQLLTNAQLDLEGALQLIVHTASKYDDCEILTFPRVKSTLKLNWYCGGKDPNAHHHVVRCAPDRVPVLPDNQVHDSYSSFRSLNLDVEWNLDVQPKRETDQFPPSILLYSSTLRCLQQYQALQKWNVTRPTRRGTYYNNLKPRRPPFLRHWRDVKVSVSFPQSVLHYWSSVALQHGIECTIDQASLSMNYLVKLIPVDSDLVQRPKANWTIVGCHGKIKNLVAYVKQRIERKDVENEAIESDLQSDDGIDHTRIILLSLEELSYSTQEAAPDKEGSEDDFTHQLETQNTKLLWNVSNKSVVLGLYDAFNQAQLLKRDLSAEALKSIKFDTPSLDDPSLLPENDGPFTLGSAVHSSIPPRQSRIRQPSSGNTMLDQLLADINNTFVSYVDERAPSDPLLKGVAAGSMNDVSKRNWIITLTNTQIALQGPEDNAYVLASSHVAQVFGREHHPQVRDGDLVSKKSWVGKIQELQYFSTVWSFTELDDNLTIPWLPFSVIRPPLALTCNDPNEEHAHTDDEASLNVLLSKLGPEEGGNNGKTSSAPPGEAVGGLVSCVLSPDNLEDDSEGTAQRRTVQLQRIASRCHCQVFYVTYGEVVESEISNMAVQSPRHKSEFKFTSVETVDTLTIRYPSVEVCTTSSQYALIMDILNNLLMNKEAKKKEALDRNARMQFTLQLANNIEDPRKPVQVQQNRVRKSLLKLRELETHLFLEQREDLRSEMRESELLSRISSAKEEVSMASNTLRAMIRAFKQSQLYMTPTRGPTDLEPADPLRRIEIWVDDAHWWLTQDDGQLQVADICFTNFSYNRVTFSDDSGEHRLELGTFSVRNLMPNTRSVYQQVLRPYDPNAKHLRVDKNICLRVYCKDKAPVAGISVKEHLEVNIVPLSVSLTAKFYQTMQDFFFPKADERTSDQQEPDHSHLFGPSGIPPTQAHYDSPDGNSPLLSRASSVRRSTLSMNSYASVATATTTGHSPPSSPLPKEANSKGKHAKQRTVDAVEKMKERATHIKTFIYVKIPQCTLCVNYKSENVSLKDIQNGRFTIPTLEYHNKNWSWTDMLMEVKKDIKSVIVQQTLKSVVGMRETDETAGLASPKMKRHASDLLLGRMLPVKGKGKKLFGKLGSSKDDVDVERNRRSLRSSSDAAVNSSTAATYQPPLSEPDMNLKRTRKLAKMTQDTTK